MPVVFVSSIPGTRVRSCCDLLRTYAQSHGHPEPVQACVEDEFQEEISIVLQQPFETLCKTCIGALDRAIAKLTPENRGADGPIAFVLMHPVLYHLRTSEFAHAYHAVEVGKCLNRHGIKVRSFVSIHDDIYDVYRNLLAPDEMFHPQIRRPVEIVGGEVASHRRNPVQDFEELRLLLDWRDRELSTAKSLSRAIECKHFLFHKKGRLRTFWDVACSGKPCVYFSHPISQPRRDIMERVDPIKNKTPDPQRGRKLIEDCQTLADHLGQIAALVEPTSIDEYRLDIARLEDVTEADLSNRVLPPLTERWPIGGGDRLAIRLTSHDHLDLAVDAQVFSSCKCKEGKLGKLASAASLLLSEIKRQINVRDNALADQADQIVAFRPFVSPDSPQPTGGVDKEIQAIRRKKQAGHHLSSPCLIIISYHADEVRRRELEFEAAWEHLTSDYTLTPNHRVNRIRDVCRQALLLSTESNDRIIEMLIETMERESLAVEPRDDSSSMPVEAMARSRDARRSFVAFLVSQTSIRKSAVHIGADSDTTNIKYLEVQDIADAIRQVREIVTQQDREVQRD